MARSGTEIMMETAIKLIMKALNLDPVLVMEKVSGVQQIVLNADQRISRMERQLALIMAHLGVADHGEQQNGSGRGCGSAHDPG